jgi:hypothetical protein
MIDFTFSSTPYRYVVGYTKLHLSQTELSVWAPSPSTDHPVPFTDFYISVNDAIIHIVAQKYSSHIGFHF